MPQGLTVDMPPGQRAKDEPFAEPANSAVDQVIDSIKVGIKTGRYVPGQRLVEPDMVRDLGISRGSVREALRRLEAEGLVQIELYRGASIRKMSRSDFIQVNQIREVLEGLAASLAAERIDEPLRAALTELEQNWDRGTRGWTYPEYNERFHNLILEASDNRQLPVYIEQAKLLFFRLQFHRITRAAAAEKRSRREHARIAAAILKGDAKAAERAMRDHVRMSSHDILSAPEEFFSK
jgi:DNA-binding GntR family transcriptional regulator